MQDPQDVKLWLRLNDSNTDGVRTLMHGLAKERALSGLGFVIGPGAAMQGGRGLINTIRMYAADSLFLSHTCSVHNVFEAGRVFETAEQAGLVPVFSAANLEYGYLSAGWIPPMPAAPISLRWFIEIFEAPCLTPEQEEDFVKSAYPGGLILPPSLVRWAGQTFPQSTYRVANFVGQTFLGAEKFRLHGFADIMLRVGAHAMLLDLSCYQDEGGVLQNLPPRVVKDIIKRFSKTP